ncbi:MAG: aldo/keto reductase, partial [Lentisphaeria bacterium]|nr:aldo/keto reductase [Lentisphaeria bacterium]
MNERMLASGNEAIAMAAFDCGVNFFDHATCYDENGAAETRFGEALPLTGLKREEIVIQSK